MTEALKFQQALIGAIVPGWREPIQALMAAAERRRPLAAYNTGTISEAACLYLLALVSRAAPAIAVEVGTFIGTSTSVISLEAGRVYTCDKSNDCFPATARILTHPFVGSKRMLSKLHGDGITVDFFFFDGRISDDELPTIVGLSKSTTVYAFDDFEGEEKGVINVNKLHPRLPVSSHVLIPPPVDVCGLDAKTTIAALVPGDWL